jgi:hypothetical protein
MEKSLVYVLGKLDNHFGIGHPEWLANMKRPIGLIAGDVRRIESGQEKGVVSRAGDCG